MRCRCSIVLRVALVVASALGLASSGFAADLPKRPNIVFILADDLGYGDVGCYGQQQIRTPNLDRLAAQGMRFTQCYAGSTVCAPSRCCLMTGKHTGHARIRGNGPLPLRPEDVTVAELLKQAGYATGIFGKWGLGDVGTTGIPNRKGFDEWFGFLNQTHAHNYYPDYLFKNEEKTPIAGNVVKNGVATERAQYAPDLFTREALAFLDKHKAEPFFLYLPYTLPHANNEAGKNGMEVPNDAPYSDRTWPQAQKNHAAMITRLDRDIGTVLQRLDDLGVAQNTIVFFSSDNGPHREGGGDPTFFQSSGPLRGIKRDLYEGGIRVPMIVRWPGQITPGSISDQVWAFWDFLPTAAELARVKPPHDIDGISMLPALVGPDRAGRPQQNRDFLYWEFHERGTQQALRSGDWKFIHRPFAETKVELFDLKNDPAETENVAAEHPEAVKKMETYLKNARIESNEYPFRPATAKKAKKKAALQGIEAYPRIGRALSQLGG